MPCGGIYPMKADGPVECWFALYSELRPKQCDNSVPELFCEEWDTFLHVKCLINFLTTEEGRCVMAHGHEIHVPIELWEDKTVNKNGLLRCSNCDHIYRPTVTTGETCPKCGAD